MPETRQPVIGVSVQAKKLPIGAVTDSNGRFTLQIPKKVKKLKVSYIGYFTQELTPRPLMQIMLKEDNTPLCYEAPVRSY